MSRFTGKILVATGAGSGIGAATAERFTADGGTVVVIDKELAAAEKVANRIDGLAIGCDVADEASVRSAISHVHQELGRIDCVLNGAGYADLAPLEEWSYERWNSMMAVHVGGTFLVTKHALPHLRSASDASIVNVASVAAFVAQEGNVPYGTAKAAIVGFTRQLAPEIAPNIRINVVAPGRILTGLTEPFMTARGGGDLEAGMALAGVHNPFQRIGRADEVAGTICHLFSDDAGFTTGSVLFVDGGETVT